MQCSNSKYECVICLETCLKPIACTQCSKLICMQHLHKIGNKCPHCRLEPFKFEQKVELSRQIELKKRQELEIMKKDSVFQCLVEGCLFSGNYHAMIIHKKSKHFEERIDEILFPEERKKKFKRDALKKLFLNMGKSNQNYHQQAIQIYAKTRGRYDFEALKKMIVHVNECPSTQCNRVEIGEECVYIGGQVIEGRLAQESSCLRAKFLKKNSNE